MSKQILAKVADYYTRKLQENGENHLGLDWNSKESQFLRFEFPVKFEGIFLISQ
jgi:hypothetical protein